MNFQEAIEFKRKLGKDQITLNGTTMNIFVTPADPNDFNKYASDYISKNFTDEISKEYSLNGQFKVQGLYTYGVIVIYKDLTK